MDKIKILMVLGSTNMGGAQIFILNLLKNIDLDVFQVDFAVNFKEVGGGIESEVRGMGCNIYYLPYFKVYNYFRFTKAWSNFLNEHHYDIVHGHSTNSASVYLRIAKEMGCKTIAHCHSAGFRGGPLQKAMKTIFIKRIGEAADYWFACSSKAAEHLFGNNYREYHNYYDIPNAINSEKYLYSDSVALKIRESIGVKEDEFLCGHVGSFSSPKNHRFLLDIFNEVLKLNPKAKLVCCGVGELLESVRSYAKELGISKKVIFPGVVHNCNEYMMAMDVFIFPSLFEGFPISVIEAEATGLPVVMSDVITNEVNVTDRIARLSLNDSAGKWAKTVLECNSQNRQECNRIICDSKYNMRTSAKLIESLYIRMVESQRISEV
jgi:glycosyltransferase involved in cell wall biosynthesis